MKYINTLSTTTTTTATTTTLCQKQLSLV